MRHVACPKPVGAFEDCPTKKGSRFFKPKTKKRVMLFFRTKKMKKRNKKQTEKAENRAKKAGFSRLTLACPKPKQIKDVGGGGWGGGNRESSIISLLKSCTN